MSRQGVQRRCHASLPQAASFQGLFKLFYQVCETPANIQCVKKHPPDGYLYQAKVEQVELGQLGVSIR